MLAVLFQSIMTKRYEVCFLDYNEKPQIKFIYADDEREAERIIRKDYDFYQINWIKDDSGHYVR